MTTTITTDRLDRLTAIIRASDDEGTIQAGRMLSLFPGKPELHTATDVRSALAAAKATADELRALARSTDDDAIEACALHQAQTWGG